MSISETDNGHFLQHISEQKYTIESIWSAIGMQGKCVKQTLINKIVDLI